MTQKRYRVVWNETPHPCVGWAARDFPSEQEAQEFADDRRRNGATIGRVTECVFEYEETER